MADRSVAVGMSFPKRERSVGVNMVMGNQKPKRMKEMKGAKMPKKGVLTKGGAQG